MTIDIELVFEGGERDGKRVPVKGARMSIGRAPDNDLVVSDASVSGQHAALALEGEKIVLEDLGSTNGTFHKARKVTRVELNPGESFQLGKVRFRIEAAAASAARPRGAGKRARAGEEGGLSESTKALLIGLAGGLLVLAIGFLALRSESSATRASLSDEGFAGPSETLLGEDRGFELDQRDPGASWEVLRASSGKVTRSSAAALEGQRCLQVELDAALGERYLPSAGLRFRTSSLPYLPAGGAISFSVQASCAGRTRAALWTRLLVDSDPAMPCGILRGALSEAGAGESYQRLATRLRASLGGSVEESYEMGLLALGRGAGAVHFDDAQAELLSAGAEPAAEEEPDRWTLDPDERFTFYWSGLGSALVGRWTHRERTHRQALLRDLSFLPTDTARVPWMDPNFAPLLAAGTSSTLRVPGVYLGAGHENIELSWSLEVVERGGVSAVRLHLARKGSGELPPISFTLPAALLSGGEQQARARYGGDEMVANWILAEDAAARRAGEAYPPLSSGDERVEGVLGLGFGPFGMRCRLNLDQPLSAVTRRIRGGLSVRLYASLAAGQELVLELAPVDPPGAMEISQIARQAQRAAARKDMGRVVALYRSVLDRAPLIPHAGSSRARRNVEDDLQNNYQPLVAGLRRSLRQAVETFDRFRRRAEQAAAIGAPGEIRALLAEIEDPDQGLQRRYAETGFAHALSGLRARLRAALGAGGSADPRAAARLELAAELERRRQERGLAGPSPLAAMLRVEH